MEEQPEKKKKKTSPDILREQGPKTASPQSWKQEINVNSASQRPCVSRS